MDGIFCKKMCPMRDKTIFFVGLFLSAALAGLGYLFAQKPWDIINTILLLNCFILLIQLYYHLKDGDPIFGKAIRELKSHAHAAALIAEALDFFSDVLRRDDKFLSAQLLSFITQARDVGHNLQAGILEIDLRPGGLFFREVDAGDHAENRLRATSFVDVKKYWLGVPGKHLLRANEMRIKSGVKIERIFIEHPEDEGSLATVISSNLKNGIDAKVVKLDEIDKVLVRDFAIIDDGRIAVELFLEERIPIRAVYYAASAEDGRRKIAELESVWRRLNYSAISANNTSKEVKGD
jgi:hypothetical protein